MTLTDSGWTWEATATIIQALATVVALAGVGVTFVYASRSERRERVKATEEAERSDAAAERSERAAALSIDTLERIAEAIESMASRGLGAALISSTPQPRVRWALTHFAGDTYMVQNVGDATAYRVTISADESLMTPQELPEQQDMRPDDSLTFMASLTLGTRDTTITVEWSNSEDDSGPREVWRYPLPPRPPRPQRNTNR